MSLAVSQISTLCGHTRVLSCLEVWSCSDAGGALPSTTDPSTQAPSSSGTLTPACPPLPMTLKPLDRLTDHLWISTRQHDQNIAKSDGDPTRSLRLHDIFLFSRKGQKATAVFILFQDAHSPLGSSTLRRKGGIVVTADSFQHLRCIFIVVHHKKARSQPDSHTIING